MTELVNISCFWGPKDRILDDDPSWSGKVLLEQDGWFEGIVTQSNDKEDMLVFGVYEQDKGIELYRVSLSSCVASTLVHAKTYLSEGILEGTFEDAYDSTELGKAFIHTVEMFDAKYLCAAKDLTKRLDMFKTEASKTTKLKLYNNMHNNRDVACEKLKKYFNGGSYADYTNAMKERCENISEGQSFIYALENTCADMTTLPFED